MVGLTTSRTGWHLIRRARMAFLAVPALVALLSTAAFAQTPLERLEISLWPEYDQPSMLVMLKAFLPADAILPATVELPIPASAGTPSAVAFRGPGGTLMNAQHTFDVAGDSILVVITAESSEVRLEYYSELDTSQIQRQYRFQWPQGSSIRQVSYEVLLPPGSSDLAVTPAGSTMPAGKGLTAVRADLGAISTETDLAIDVRYSKTVPGLSVSALPQQQPAPAFPPPAAGSSGETQADTGVDPVWPILLFVAIAAFLGGIWLARTGKGS